MDSFFGVGLPELVLILILAGIILGPHRIRQVAHTIGKVTAQLQVVSRQFMRQLNAELDGLEDGTVRNTMQDVRDLQKEVEELRKELGQVPKSLRGDGQKIVEEAESTMNPDSTSKANGSEVSTDQEQSEPAPEEKPSLPKALDIPGDPE
jgi:Sec-independent protein translocase protein TatA